LTRRYFQSRGPATVKDFSTWSGLTMADCKKGIEMLKPELLREQVDKEDFYLFSNISANAKAAQNLHLLPIYDEYIMGYKDKRHLLQYRGGIRSVPSIRFMNMIVLNGQIIGSWRREIQGKCIDLEYEFFAPTEETTQILFEQAVRRFEEFNGLTVRTQAQVTG
ncbi:MAG: winged helix DNA-binding domain-containing protein, partial [Phycisphaerae bacterium]|nr:winged helix DNA-binding domain-containing protein [Saprospiraceae bacterium]